jgi:hypothetical protein
MQNETNHDEMIGIKKNPLREVTSVSKVLSAIIFISLPFFGFWLGTQYQTEPVQLPTTFLKPSASSEKVEEEITLTETVFGDFELNRTKYGLFINYTRVPSNDDITWEEFELLAGGYGPIGLWYGKDKTSVYCGGHQDRDAKIIEGAQPETFEVINIQLGADFTFAKDALHVYSGCSVLEGADPLTFTIEHTPGVGYKMQDKNKVWFDVNENFNSNI